MGLVQKIFYVHLPSAWMFLLAAIICGVASVRFLFGGDPRQDRLRLGGGRARGPVRRDHARHGTALGAQSVGRRGGSGMCA